jgi:transposase
MPRVRQKTHHSPHKRTRIVMMKDLGVPLDEIVAKEGIIKHAIFGIVRRYRSQISAKDKPRSGRLTILTDRDKKHIDQLVDRLPFIAVQEIKDQTGISCHRSTITRWLKKQGI